MSKPIVAKLNHLQISSQKVRLVADLIRGKETEEAQDILRFTVKKGVDSLRKLLNSALANAENNFDINVDEEKLKVSEIVVNEGPTMKRWSAEARGRTDEIHKRSSHIKMVLTKIEE